MQLELTRIGNSRGIRIPKPLIEQCRLGKVVEVHVTPKGLLIAPQRTPRLGWKEAFAASVSPQREELLLGRVPGNKFDSEEWEW
jgi:antitoxin MazE